MTIRSAIKSSVGIKKHFYGLRRVLYAMAMAALAVKKTDKNKVLLNHMQGLGFADNPRAIAEKLHEMAPDMKMIWVCENKEAEESLPDYVTPVKLDSIRYLSELATAGTWIFNILPARGIRKKNDQVYIQTYHGDRALKKVQYQNVGKEETDKKYAVQDDICDYGVTGSVIGEELFRKDIGFHGSLIKKGTPRCDCLINPDEKRLDSIINSLGVRGKKLLLYAPTFRDGERDVESAIDFDRILDILENKTGEPWILLYRAHSKTRNLKINESNRSINVSQYPDMADLLMVSDILVTDYSSSSGDFCLTGRPVFLYLDEKEFYSRKMRFDIDSTPYFISHNQAELEALVSNTSEKQAEENDRELIKFWGIYETGNSSAAVAEIVIRHARA